MPVGVHFDLSNAVAGGEHCQNRFKEGTADDFDSSLLDECGDAVEVFGMFVGEPFNQRAAGVQGEFNGIVSFKDIEEGKITFLISLLHHVPEIADGLMVVDSKNETYPIHKGGFIGKH